MLSLNGCAREKQIEYVYFTPPALLLDDCRLPSREGVKTVGDMVRVLKEDEAAVAITNANLYALREYRANLLRMQVEQRMTK